MLCPIGEIGGMDQAKGGRSEQLLLLATAGRFLDEGRGVPLTEEDGIPFTNKPLP